MTYYKVNEKRHIYIPLLNKMEHDGITGIFVSIQTCGLMPSDDCGILQLAAVKCKLKKGVFVPIDKLNIYFKPDSGIIPPDIVKRTGITEKKVSKAKPIEEQWYAIRSFFGERFVLFTHNLGFLDVFISDLFIRKGLFISPYAKVDTLPLAQDTIRPGLVQGYSYRNLFNFLNLKNVGYDSLLIAENLVTMTNALMLRYRTRPPRTGHYMPVIIKMEYAGRDGRIILGTEYGNLSFSCSNYFWEDDEGAILLQFFDMDKLQKNAFRRIGASNEADFCRKMRHLLIA